MNKKMWFLTKMSLKKKIKTKWFLIANLIFLIVIVGLVNIDHIIKKFGGGPVGIDSIASSIGEESTTIEDVIEPFLLQEGYVKRTSRGRIVTEKTYKEFKINEQKTLFDYE